MNTYSDHTPINILTSLLVAHGIKDVVVCPGSRNAPLAHNFEVCPYLTVHPVTDERSAGFYALGMSLHDHAPVAVCVTSGTALLNLCPAVAEACYRQAPLVILTADRPAAWIDQLDGQTLPQQGAFGCFVGISVTLPGHCNTEEDHWHINRLVNEALMNLQKTGALPVHINVPIAEPLYNFTMPALPHERVIRCQCVETNALPPQLAADLGAAKRPLLVIGQTDKPIPQSLADRLALHMALLYEPLSVDGRQSIPEDDIDRQIAPESIDLILYAGDCLVNKRMRQLLRRSTKARVWGIGSQKTVPDPTMHLQAWCPTDNLTTTLRLLCNYHSQADSNFLFKWRQSVERRWKKDDDTGVDHQEAAVVSQMEKHLEALPAKHTDKIWERKRGVAVHYANSTAVRLGLCFARHYIYVNRGVNGIEGCMSTAAGAALAAQHTDTDIFLVIGDLSFFYDANALWNTQLAGNLHILLLNNGGGAIFNRFKGLYGSPARERVVMACHRAMAGGICASYDIRYLHAVGASGISEEMWQQFFARGNRPVVLEVLLPI